MSESNSESALLDSKISLTTHYHRQRETIITWLDEQSNYDLAISFQELEGAQETWEIICRIQGKDPDELSPEEGSDDEMLQLFMRKYIPFTITNTSFIAEFMPNQDNLTEIYDELQNIDQNRRNRVIDKIFENDESFLKKLQELFNNLEDLEAHEQLKKMFLVFKALLNISDMKLLETLLSDQYYLTTFGALEYNTEISMRHQETKHRTFLKEKARFNNFITLTDKEVIDKIHINYRLSYLKDTALATGLDEANIQTIANLMSNNNSEVIQNILLNPDNIGQIFEKLKCDQIEVRKEAINFLSEIFSISKNLQVQGRLNLLSSLKSIEEFNLSILVRQ